MQTLYTRVKMSKLIIFYMIIHNLLNIDLNQINLSINTSNTRANDLRLVLPAPRTSIMLHSFAYTTGKMWNAMPIKCYICFIFAYF